MYEYKGYRIVGDGTFGMQSITTIGSGKLPVKLSGKFTNKSTAEKSIDAYLRTKEEGTSVGKTSSSRRGK